MSKNKGKSIIALPSDYVVIDTETTGLDFRHNHIIEISAIRYSKGNAVDKFTSLIKPPLLTTNHDEGEQSPKYVDDFITNLTGITNEMLDTAPAPAKVIPAFLDFIGNSILIGHNVNFDINFLCNAAERVGNHFLTNDFIDTMRIARKVFPELEHHRLSDVSEACGVAAPNAHRAEADCLTTAACYEQMKARIFAEETEETFQKRFTRTSRYAADLKTITAATDQIDDTNPIYGKTVVFTGAMSTMTRKEAFQLVADLGGIPHNSITKETNYLVIGNKEFASSVKDGKTNKMLKAESYLEKGQEIAIISESSFQDLLLDWISSQEIEIFDFLVPHLKEVLNCNCVGEDCIKAKPGRNFTSVQYIKPEQLDSNGNPVKVRTEKLAFRIIARFGEYSFQIAVGDEYIDIPFSNDSDGITQHISTLKQALDAVIDDGTCEYSCCSRVEQCSDARRCINPYPYIAANCNYRKVLKSGRVFYGKNRTVDG